MADIVFVRIDDRLLHGQVGREWVKSEGADLIAVGNDKIAEDPKDQKLMNIATPLFADSLFVKVDDLVERLKDNEDRKALILIASPKEAYKLVENGLDVSTINVGNMRKLDSKEEINPNVYIGSEDRLYFNKLADKGISFDIRTLPNDKPVDEDKLL
ncbi:MAG: PTS sugar transporter subunit IIB [Anaerococcus sp.]|nr:PTS sugar transporter subunit IIB [Anaerococcus sp.]